MINIDDTEARLRELLTQMQTRQKIGSGGRALSLAITKLEECLMWLSQEGA